MPIRLIKKTDILPPRRDRQSVLKSTQEWTDVIAFLNHKKRLTPQEAIEVDLPDALIKKSGLKSGRRIFLDMVKGEIKARKLPYDLFIRKTARGQIIYIAGR